MLRCGSLHGGGIGVCGEGAAMLWRMGLFTYKKKRTGEEKQERERKQE